MLSNFRASAALTRLEACGVVSPLPSNSIGEAVTPSALVPPALSVELAVSEALEEAVAGRRTFSLGGRVV